MPKRATQSGEKCRAAKRARNKDDSSRRKISRSKLNRKTKDDKNVVLRLSALLLARCAVLIYLLVTSAGRRARVGARLIPQRLLYLTAERAA